MRLANPPVTTAGRFIHKTVAKFVGDKLEALTIVQNQLIGNNY